MFANITRVSLAEARPKLSFLVTAARDGDRILLCRYHKPIAALVAPWELGFLMEQAGEAPPDEAPPALAGAPPPPKSRDELTADLDLVRQHLAPLDIGSSDSPPVELARLAAAEIMRLRVDNPSRT